MSDLNQQKEQFQNITNDQYKIYNIELLKSQFKVYQSQAMPNKAYSEDQIRGEQQPANLSFFPITLESANKDKNPIDSSFDGVQKRMPQRNLEIQIETKNLNKQQKIKPIIDQALEQWQNRPRRCSNSRFHSNFNQQENGLAQQLQMISKDPAKYKESKYFSKKDRVLDIKNIEDLFQNEYSKYKNPEFTNQITIQSPISNVQSYMVPPSPLSTHSEKQKRLSQPERKFNFPNFYKRSGEVIPEGANYNQLKEKWIIGTEPRIKNINQSPNKSPAYLLSESKKEYRYKISDVIFRGQVSLKEEYLQQNRLRDQYLQNAKERSDEIHRQLLKLKYPTKTSNQNDKPLSRQSSSRKKIFEPIQRNIFTKPTQAPRNQENYKDNSLNSSRKQSIVKNIFSSRLEKEGLTPKKRKNNSLSFNYFKQSPIKTRVSIFNSKEKQKLSIIKTTQQKSKQKTKVNNTSPKPISPKKCQVNHHLSLLDMNSKVREWYNKNEKQIIAQSQKIYSYELITRYIGSTEIEVRIEQFIKGMIEPKRWILLMVDGVYARLKDRYIP